MLVCLGEAHGLDGLLGLEAARCPAPRRPEDGPTAWSVHASVGARLSGGRGGEPDRRAGNLPARKSPLAASCGGSPAKGGADRFPSPRGLGLLGRRHRRVRRGRRPEHQSFPRDTPASPARRAREALVRKPPWSKRSEGNRSGAANTGGKRPRPRGSDARLPCAAPKVTEACLSARADGRADSNGTLARPSCPRKGDGRKEAVQSGRAAIGLTPPEVVSFGAPESGARLPAFRREGQAAGIAGGAGSPPLPR